MLIGNSGTVDEMEIVKIDSEFGDGSETDSQRSRLYRRAETFSFKFIRVARFLKDNAPHAFQIREMGTDAKNSMDRWLWDLLD